MAKKQAGTPATARLTEAGVVFSTHAYAHDPRAASYGLEAAHELGLPAAHVFKTLVAQVDDDPVVAVVPVDGTCDLKALAAAAGGRRAQLVEPATAQRITGYVVGAISPLGQRRRLRTFVDASARGLAVVYVSGGRRGLDIGLAPADLMAMTDGVYAALARHSRPG